MRKGFTTIIVLGIIILISIIAGALILSQKSTTSNTSPTVQTAVTSPSIINSPLPQHTSADTVNWKTFIFDKISFKYPPNWSDPIYFKAPSPMAKINKSGDQSQTITVLNGVNYGYSEQKLSDWINTNASIPGNKKLTIDGSDASEGYVTHQGVIATIGIYVTAQDKKSQYSITIDNPEKLSDQEMNKLMDDILSTFKFTN